MRMRFLTKIFSSNEEEEEDIISDVTSGNSLSWSTRIKCFLFCFLFGIFLSVMGSVSVFFRNFVMFSILFSIGSVMSMASTCFLMGPVKQLKKMVDPTRWISTMIVLLMIILTLFSAFYWKKGALCLLFVIFQYLAMTWYSLSYIPYARSAVKSCLQTCPETKQKKSVHNFIYTVDGTSCPVKLNNCFNFNFTSNIPLDIYFSN
ncbi:Vesicle transport protein SFT2B [Trichinella zimbabwensis]|uniref:Vesicle transport protein n=1 Tax=Trichinella zimbabwensis TaxID=268475 RepID=A0A0V1I4F2_9BILA|nr:Vesicle transport protein SFT2B [Trichinella zimbabwensis]